MRTNTYKGQRKRTMISRNLWATTNAELRVTNIKYIVFFLLMRSREASYAPRLYIIYLTDGYIKLWDSMA